MSCASLGLILCPQTPGNHFNSRIFCQSSSFWLDEVSDSPQQRGGHSAGRWTVRDHPADIPFFLGSLLEVLLAFSDSTRLRPDSPPYACEQSAGLGRTVRVARADSPPLLAGQSASAWQLCSLVRFLPPFFRASACASRNHS
jgi:hypothetical protein